ncbi:mucin-2-like isoform X2 [Euwallacea fornicatus]|uniref:mucin-2-like isoform X2 n=1 Tax=Euwallacea fornicatus TaxID=995702 RepID=UPI0033903A37
MMSPLFIVGITLLTTVLGDVSHVLQEQAHPPADPQDINNAFTSNDFWWMRDDSPLKASYDYFKKCAATGKCASDKTRAQFNIDDEGTAPIDVKKNVFLNGNFVASSVSKNALSAGNSSETKSFHSGAKLDFSNNPFLQGGFAHAGSATSSSSQACNGSDRTCVPIEDCSNGVVLASATIKNTSRRCDKNQVCCRLHPGGKSSVADHINQLLFIPGKSKVTGKDGLTSEQVQIIHTSQEGIRPQINLIGEFVGSSTVKPVRDLSAAANSPVFSSTPDYSNFNFGDGARNSDFDGPDYLPPVKPTTCPPGQFVGSFGRCEPKRPECPSGSRPTPSGGCEVLKCPPGEQLGPYGRCIPIPTPPPLTCPPGQKLGPYGNCVPISTPPPPPPPPVCPPGQKPGPYGGCVSIPTPPPPPPVCPPGQKPGPYGGCVSTPTPPPPPPVTCPPGQKQGSYGNCVPISTPPPPPPPLVCPPGQKPGPYGGCVSIPTPPPPPPVTCPPGQKQGSYGNCVPISTPPPPPPPPVCPPGQKPGPYGGCVSIPTPPPPPPVTCPPGQKQSSYGNCVPISTPPPPPPPPVCPPGQKPGPYGGCVSIPTPPPPPPPPVCPPGQKPGPYGGCVSVPTPPPPPSVTCPPGQKQGSYGSCVPISTPPPPPPPPDCPPGQKPGPYGGCVSIPTPPPPPPPPVCPPGQKPGPYGGCVSVPTPPPPPPVTCPPGQKQGSYGSCVPISTPPPPPPPPDCPLGQKPGPYGGCISIPTPPPRPPPSVCPPGQKPGPYGSCLSISTPPPYCPSGHREGPNGACIPITTITPAPPRPYCATGEKLVNGKCVSICGPEEKPTLLGTCLPIRPTPTPPPPPPRKCLSGQKLVNGKCVTLCGSGQRPTQFGGCEDVIVSPPPLYCPSGYREGHNGECIPIITTTPAPPAPYCARGEKLVNGQCVAICAPGQKPSLIGTCEPVTHTTLPPSCPTNKKLLNGVCIPIACPPGQKLDLDRCVPIPPPQPPISCPPGQKYGPYGCVPISTPAPPAPYCAKGEKLVNGKCVAVCGPGQKPTLIGTCEPVTHTTLPPSCPTNKKLLNGVCIPIACPPGQKLDLDRCVSIPPPQPPISCPPGQKYGPYGCVPISTPAPPTPYCAKGEKLVNGKCVLICGPGEKPTLIGTCVSIRPPPPTTPECPIGTKLVNGKCISITPQPPSPPLCQPGEQRNPFGECVKPQPPTKTCRPGYELNRYGNCEKIQKPGPYCPSGQREVNGGCVEVEKCRPGEEFGPFGCRRKPCPPGSVLSVSGNCESSPRPTPTCPPGTIKTPSGRCEPTPPPPPPPCPPGSYLGSHGCVKLPTNYLPPETTTPRSQSGEDINDGDYNPEADSTHISILKTTLPPRRRENDTVIPDELVPVGCAAALKCVQEIYCTADGFVSPVPVVLTKEQELLKAPTTVCRDIESGTLGKCCRDRDYQDPWPSANLVNGVDDGQYAEDDSIGQYKVKYNRISRSSARRTKRATGECGTRHLNSSPRGQVPIDADFAEISWQAMILRDSNRSLLCGGAIIRRNAVLTAAHCVEGLQTSDVLIKGGEWKLGIDEEPLPFQIVKVAAILRHPDFKAGSLQNDLAVLVLEENLRFSKNIEQICLPEPNLIPTQNCIATGWGKRILQLHAKNALMHRIDVNVMDVEQCQEVMGQYFQKLLPNYNTNALCGFSDVDQCKVDYGSALACADESGRYTLSGIYSWDTGCKQQGQIGGYVAPDVEWVETILSTPLKQLKRLDRLYNSARVQ